MRRVEMQNTNLELLSFKKELTRRLTGFKHHFRGMDQAFYTGFNTSKCAIGHHTGDDGGMGRTDSKLSGCAVPRIGSDALQTQCNPAAFSRNIQYLNTD